MRAPVKALRKAVKAMGRRTTARVWRAPPSAVILFAGLALVAVVLVFATPVNHDEDQYLAASVLAGRLRLYQDFLYVQTPLQPELTAPLAGVAPGWTFLVLRLVSAGCGLAALGGVWTAQRRLGVARRRAELAVLLMASCYTFQYCASVARNDALPMALLAWAIAEAAAALRATARRPWLRWAMCGLLLGAAVSAKVSFAPLLGVTGVFVCGRLMREASRRRAVEATALGAGALAGLAPIAIAWASAPEAVGFALAGFWGDGPRRWYVANGLEHRMAPLCKLLYGLGDLLLGPALAALVLTGLSRLRPGPVRCGDVRSRLAARPDDPGRPGGGVRAVAHLQAVFRAAPAAAFRPPRPGRREGRRPAWAQGLVALGAGIGGILLLTKVAQAAWTGRWTPVEVARENGWIGETLRRARASGPIATLSAHAVLDSGYPLDPRFAGGAMIYRSADGVVAPLRRRLHITSPNSLAADLDAAPPSAIVTGYEGVGGDTRVDLDAPLRAYAQARGYVPSRSPAGAAQLYVRPQGAGRVER